MLLLTEDYCEQMLIAKTTLLATSILRGKGVSQRKAKYYSIGEYQFSDTSLDLEKDFIRRSEGSLKCMH